LKDVDRALPRPALRRCHIAVRPGPQPKATPAAAGTSACLADRATAGQYPPLFPARPRRSAIAAHRRRVDWLLETALGQCRLWQDQGMRRDVAVNFSMRGLRDRQVLAAAADLLRWLAAQPTGLFVAG
jgi:hypothetical protein